MQLDSTPPAAVVGSIATPEDPGIALFGRLDVALLLDSGSGNNTADTAFNMIHSSWLPILAAEDVYPYKATPLHLSAAFGEAEHVFTDAVCLAVYILGTSNIPPHDSIEFYINYDMRDSSATLILGFRVITKYALNVSEFKVV
jgi:hypothetical protein